MHTRLRITLPAVLIIAFSGCAASQDDPAAAPFIDTTVQSTATPEPARTGDTQVSATRVRFTTGGAEIIVRLAENPTSRDFVSKLPLTLTFEEFAGREKISYLPERLVTAGSPGVAPQNGDLIYFVPWGNLGFFLL